MDIDMPSGTPWLGEIAFHSSRDYECSLPTAEQCEYQQGYWRFWYQADHRYALPTVAFFLTVIVLFGLAHHVPWPERTPLKRRVVGLSRYMSYRLFRIRQLDWNSAPAGVLFLGAVGLIFFMCMVLAPKPYYWPTNAHWGDSPPLATRSGWMALACLPFVIATAGKSNLITLMTGVSHEKLQVYHRWISYAMFVLAVLHTFSFIVFDTSQGTMVLNWKTSVFYWTGVVALLAQAWLTFASFGPLRNLAYETFKFLHLLAALVFVLFFFFHCDFTLTSVDYFIATGVVFALHWLHRQIKIYIENGLKLKATVSLMSNGFAKVLVPTTARWTVGQHFFIRFLQPNIHLLATHPFTACSLPVKQRFDQSLVSNLHFYIRPQGGFTQFLAKQAAAKPNCELRVTLDGPYGGLEMEKIANSKRMLIIAGGSGAGWMLPMLSAFLRKPQASGDEPASLRMILATRDIATRHWSEEAVAATLAADSNFQASARVDIEIYYTGDEEDAKTNVTEAQFLQNLDDPEKAPIEHPTKASSISSSGERSPSGIASSVEARVYNSRPNLPSILEAEADAVKPDTPLGIFVCGPLSMQHDVSNAAARAQPRALKSGTDIYLHMEHFAWA